MRRHALVFVIATFASGGIMADSRAQIDAGLHDTRETFHRLNPSDESLEKRAFAVLVFPHVAKGGEGVAREYGEGALQVKGQTVGYYSLTGASRGLTLGVAYHREVLLFMTKSLLDRFQRASAWTVGSETGLVLISAQSHGELDQSVINKPILAFVFGENGLFDDLDIQGSSIVAIQR